MSLKEQVFTDVYLGSEGVWLAGVPGERDPVPAPENCSAELQSLREACQKIHHGKNKNEFALDHNGTRYRVSVLDHLTDTVYVLRRFPDKIPALETLGLPLAKIYLPRLLDKNLSGLVVISGSYGQGKTTTAASIVTERLTRIGGVCITAEDPPEMPLEGRHGEGVCYQTWVEKDGFAHACRQAARWAPSIIFLGEVRDAETATEALRASINGRLIICTTHADSVQHTVDRLFSLANGAAGNSDDVSSLLSAGLSIVIHQKLESINGIRRLKLSSLWLGEESKGIRNTIRQRQFNQIENAINFQFNRDFMNGGK